jgi:hypothetical protein
MDGDRQLAAAVSIAHTLADAVGSGATPSDDTPHGQVIRAVLGAGVGDLGPEALDEIRDRLMRAGRSRQDVVQAVLDLTEPVSQLLTSGRPVPSALAGPQRAPGDLDEVSREVFATVAARRATAAMANRQEDTAGMWWQIARDAGHPLAIASPHPVVAVPGGFVPVAWSGAAVRSRGPRWRRVLVRSVVPVVLVAVVAWLVVRSLGPDKHDVPGSLSGFDAACDGGVYPDAPSYQGPPPHPTAALSTDALQLPGPGRSRIWGPVPALPADQKLSGIFNPNDPKQVQAVACADFTGMDTAAIKQCTYVDYSQPGALTRPGTPVTMYPGLFTITLYEARTHRTVAEVKVTGAGNDCPDKIPVTRYELYSQLTIDQYAQALSQEIGG